MAGWPIRTGGTSRVAATSFVQVLTRAGTAPRAPATRDKVTRDSAATHETAAVHVAVGTRALAATHAWRAGPVRAGAPVWTRC
jgi:hypothetical protein